MDNIFDEYGNIESAIKFPYSREDRILNYLSVLVFTITSPLIIPLFVLLGYTVELRSSTLNKEQNPPTFSNYDKLWREGYRMMVCYLPVLVLSVIFFFLGVIYAPLSVLSLSPVFLLPAISVRYSQTRRYESVYDNKLFRIVSDEKYAKAWIKYIFHILYMIGIIALISLFTFGIGLLFIIPFVVTYRSVYWGSIVQDIGLE